MQKDGVDRIVGQWHAQRPDLDVSGMEIIGRLGRLNKQIRPLLDAVFVGHGLESWEFDVLATLLRSGPPHQLTPGDLLESTMVTSGAMTNRLDRLQGRGLILRSKSPTDGRQVIVTLTQGGLSLIDAAVTDHADNERRLLEGLDTTQQRELVDLLRALQFAVDAFVDTSA